MNVRRASADRSSRTLPRRSGATMSQTPPLRRPWNLEIVAADTPVAEFADEIPRILRHKRQRDTLTSTGGDDGDEGSKSACPGHDADGT